MMTFRVPTAQCFPSLQVVAPPPSEVQKETLRESELSTVTGKPEMEPNLPGKSEIVSEVNMVGKHGMFTR